MPEVRGTDRVTAIGHMRDLPTPWSTADLSDEVVGQRVTVTVQMSANDDRGERSDLPPARLGKWGVAVWMDRGGPDDSWFKVTPESYRGMDGVGLTPSEARYVASTLYQAARRLMAAAGVDVK